MLFRSSLFAQDVVKYRGGKLKQPIASLANGRVWGGAAALEIGLIDGIDTPEEYFSKSRTSPSFVDGKKTGLSSLLKGSISEVGVQVRNELFASFRPRWD